jgi:hypothetical protein
MESRRWTPGEALARWAGAPLPVASSDATSERKERFVAAIGSTMGRMLVSRQRAKTKMRIIITAAATAAGIVLAIGPALAYMSWRDRVAARAAPGPAHDGTPAASLAGAEPTPTPLGGNPAALEPETVRATPSRVGGQLIRVLPKHGRSRPTFAGVSAPPPEAAGDRARSEPTDERLSDLAEQNRLFALSMAARERGDERGAVRLLDEFMRLYPSSPLVQDAHVSRLRALYRLGDHAACAREAQRYLRAYPDGFAAEEAQRLARDPASSPAPPPRAFP